MKKKWSKPQLITLSAKDLISKIKAAARSSMCQIMDFR